jgi:nicotinamidase-related amidase
MNTPTFYHPEQVGTLYTPNIPAATAAGRDANLSPATDDAKRIYLLVVDAQVDFVHPDGALPVSGAVEDTRRLVDWLYAHMGKISKIGLTLDTHLPIQIFHPAWWVDENGQHPAGFTPITSADISNGLVIGLSMKKYGRVSMWIFWRKPLKSS